ncbi:MAG: hypothetical protein AB1724_10840 [Thermodesulfobacteriota bacterium]
MRCPVCGCLHFHVKDAVDEYDTHEFTIANDSAIFPESREDLIVEDLTHVYCNGCAWHGEFGKVRKTP